MLNQLVIKTWLTSATESLYFTNCPNGNPPELAKKLATTTRDTGFFAKTKKLNKWSGYTLVASEKFNLFFSDENNNLPIKN